MNIREFFPPILIKLANKVVRSAKNRVDFEEYNSYSEALSVSTSDAYQNIELCNMIAEQTITYMSDLKAFPFNLSLNHALLLASISQYLNNNTTKSLKILDLGGGCGAHFFEIKRLIPADISLKWFVVETPQMVKSAFERKLNSDELFFVSSIDDIKTKIDFIHSSGALQYVPNPHELLDALIKLKANRMLFSRMMFNEGDRDLITVQKSWLSVNGPGNLPKGYTEKIISYPHTTISFNKFNNKIINGGYEAHWMSEDTSGIFQIKNEKIVGKTLLYVRK